MRAQKKKKKKKTNNFIKWVNLVARWSLKFKKKLNWSWYDWFDKLILNNLVKIQFKF